MKKPILDTDEIELEKGEFATPQGDEIFDKNSEVFNDICTSFTSENGTDVPLKSRREDYYKGES